MTRAAFLTAAAVLLASPAAPALAGASNFNLVNGTAGGLSELAIRRAGNGEWRTLSAARSPGAKGDVPFSDPDCAFDIRATVGGAGPVTWTGINLCGAKSVTLKKDEEAGLWVDYDE
jgi:hypothetical protein